MPVYSVSYSDHKNLLEVVRGNNRKLQLDIIKWLLESKISWSQGWIDSGGSFGSFGLIFKREEDLMAFTLRWL